MLVSNPLDCPILPQITLYLFQGILKIPWTARVTIVQVLRRLLSEKVLLFRIQRYKLLESRFPIGAPLILSDQSLPISPPFFGYILTFSNSYFPSLNAYSLIRLGTFLFPSFIVSSHPKQTLKPFLVCVTNNSLPYPLLRILSLPIYDLQLPFWIVSYLFAVRMPTSKVIFF